MQMLAFDLQTKKTKKEKSKGEKQNEKTCASLDENAKQRTPCIVLASG